MMDLLNNPPTPHHQRNQRWSGHKDTRDVRKCWQGRLKRVNLSLKFRLTKMSLQIALKDEQPLAYSGYKESACEIKL